MGSRSYRPILFFLWQYKLLYGGILLLILVTAVLESLSVVAFFPIFSSLLSESDDVGGILGLVSDGAAVLPFSDPIVSASVLLIIIFVMKTLLVLLREVLIAHASARVLHDVKEQIIERYGSAHYQFFLDSKQGTLIYNGLNAPIAVGALLLNGPQMVAFLFKILAVSIVLMFVFPFAALAFGVLGLAYYVLIHLLSGKVSFKLGRGLTAAGIEQTVITNEFLTGIRQIIALGAVRQWLQQFEGVNRTYQHLQARHLSWMAAPRPVMELSAVGLMLAFLLGLRVLSPGDFAEALPRLGVFAVSLAQLMPALTGFGRLRMSVMGALPDVALAHQAITSPVPRRREGGIPLESFEGELAFQNVTFAHKGREPLMKEVDLTFEKGRVTAIVGPSGAGKTTVVNLILGLFEPNEGQIVVDGIPLKDLNHESWLSKIGFVSQDPFTYHATIQENILFGRDGHSLESAVKAARIANIHEFISGLPDGYDTIVGDRGMTLSGGQQQRVAIARAVLDEPQILIFDEATSSLDTISERLVQEAIDNVSRNRTVIVIAHRLSTIRHADKIVVLDEGRVVEEGNHQELLSKKGQYSRMVAV